MPWIHESAADPSLSSGIRSTDRFRYFFFLTAFFGAGFAPSTVGR